MAGYYTRIEFDPQLVKVYTTLLDTVANYRRAGLIADATRVELVLVALQADYERLAVRGAAKATAYIRDRLRQTAVRPPTSGNLSRAVVSRPLPPVAGVFPGGSIGIADIDELNRGAVNPRSGGIYWRAQEYGLPVDPNQKPVPGYFQPGFSRPDPGEFRNHPYFEQMSYRRGMPAMVRTRPLRARHYLRDGVDQYVTWHAQEAARIRRRAITRLLRR